MVLDASAVVELLLGSERGERVAAALAAATVGLQAPDLLDVEALQAFRRLERTSAITPARAAGAVDLLARLPIERRPAAPLAPRIWALRGALTAYDAAYVALAEALGVPLVTCDAALGRAHGHGADVRVVG